jgi:hypothetical protein
MELWVSGEYQKWQPVDAVGLVLWPDLLRFGEVRSRFPPSATVTSRETLFITPNNIAERDRYIKYSFGSKDFLCIFPIPISSASMLQI